MKKYIGAKLHIGQQKLLEHLKNSTAMYETICCSRQWGKTFFLQQLILMYAINNPKSNTLFCSPTYSQVNKVKKSIINGIKKSGIIDHLDGEQNAIILKNGSTIYFRSVKIYDNIRGLSIDFLFADEAAMYSDEAFYAALRPTLTVKGKKCFLISTPKGKSNFFYQCYMKGINPDESRYRTFYCTYRDNPFANLDEINDAKKSLPKRLYDQEYEAKFVDGGGDVFEDIESVSILSSYSEPIGGMKYFAGIDLGNSDDYTVLTVMDSNGKVVYIYRDRHKDWTTIINNIIKILKKYNATTFVEVNGLGSPVFDLLKKQYPVIPWITSNKSKQDIIESLIISFQDKDIKIPTRELEPDLYNELQDFSFTYSKSTRTIIYAARSGHDDTVMSLAICNNARKTKGKLGEYYIA